MYLKILSHAEGNIYLFLKKKEEMHNSCPLPTTHCAQMGSPIDKVQLSHCLTNSAGRTVGMFKFLLRNRNFKCGLKCPLFL